jgi:AraC-like DNA-binding protein
MQEDLVEACLRAAPRAGTHSTTVPALQIVRSDRPLPRVHTVHRPSLCFLAQGAKVVTVGGEVFRFRSPDFLYSSVDLPATGEIVEATPRKPYLCLVLEIEPSVVFELASATAALRATAPDRASKGIFVGTSDPIMTDAFARLLRCLRDPMDARVLAPNTVREIMYHLLQGPWGAAVREIGVVDSQTQRIGKVIELLKRDYARPLHTLQLARAAGMSASSFHHHFKRVTNHSPLQYQKQLRLQEARRLLFADASAANVGFQVGYESASQFSREYARLFGLPPRSDVRRLAATPGSARPRGHARARR